MATADFHIIGDTKLDGSGFQKGLGKLGNLAAKGLAVVSGALAGMGAYAIKVGSEFESGMSEVAAISGATGDDLTRLADKAKEMGAATKFSATESAEALKYMAMAGWDTENMLAGLPGVMNLAAASGESLAAVSDIVTDAMTAFGETIDEGSITHFADVLAATSSSANTNVGLMGETFKYVAPLAGALGYSINDTAQAIGLMANAGIKGGQAGTALRAILSRLINPTNEVTSAMAALGLSMTDASGEALPLGMLMENLRQAFAGLSEAEKTQMAAALGGQEAMSGLLAIVNASEEDYAKLADAIADSDGAASAMAATMNDNLQGSITILKSALEGLGIQFYESIDAPLREIAQAATTYVGILSDAFVSGGLTALVQALGSVLADAATQLVQTAPQLVSAAVSVVDALVAGLAANAPQLLDAATALGAALLQGLAGLLPTVGSFAASLFAALYPRLMEGVPRLTELGIDWLGALGEGLRTGLPVLLEQAMPLLLEFTATLRQNAGLLVDAALDLLLNLADGLIAALPVLLATVPQIIINLAGIINDNAPKLLVAGMELLGKLAMGLLQALPELVSAVPQIIMAIVALFTAFNWVSLGKNLIAFLSDGIRSMASAAEQAARGILTSIQEGIASLPGHMLSLGQSAVQSLSYGIQMLLYDAQMAGLSLLQTVQLALTSLPSVLLSLAQNAMSAFVGALQSAIAAAASAAQGLLTGIIGGIQALPARALSIVQSTISGVVNAFTSVDWHGIGINIINGIIAGISGAVSRLVDAAVNAAKSAFNAAKNFLGIASPSKLFREKVGRMIPQGMALGVEMDTEKVAAAVDEMARTAYLEVNAAQTGAAGWAAAEITAGGSGESVDAAPSQPPTAYTQNIYFEQPMQAPDEIARALRIQNTYGLAGAR